MENTATAINFAQIAKRQDEIVKSVISQKTLLGFEKAYAVSSAIVQLKELLTNEYLAPIMALQGTKLGFRTDKDRNKDGSKGPGYPVDVVRTCVIEAVFLGLQTTGNHFNIIAGNMYPTKEGCGYLLNNWPGLKQSIVLDITRINDQKTSASVKATIKWSVKEEPERVEEVPIPIKIDSYTSVDAMIGKATRKARAWLLSQISGQEIAASDLEDIPFVDLTEKQPKEKPALTQDDLLDAIMAIKAGNTTVEQIESDYAITPEQKKILQDGIKA